MRKGLIHSTVCSYASQLLLRLLRWYRYNDFDFSTVQLAYCVLVILGTRSCIICDSNIILWCRNLNHFFLILNVSIILFLILIYSIYISASPSLSVFPITLISPPWSLGGGKKGLPLISLPLIRVTLSNWRFLSGFMCPILLREHQEKNVSDYIIQRKHMWSFTLPDWLLFPIRKNHLWWKLLMTTLSNLQFRNWFGLNCLKMKIYNRPPCNPLLPTMPSFSWVYFPRLFISWLNLSLGQGHYYESFGGKKASGQRRK